MKRQIIITGDGSTTIHIPEWNENYHSKHGAIQEAYHVFIKQGLDYFLESKLFQKSPEIFILEMGFGTGLNALITYKESKKNNLSINYVGVEAYPVSLKEVHVLNYSEKLNIEAAVLEKKHTCLWGQTIDISSNFKLLKLQKSFENINIKEEFDIIYFDAFGPRVQPELWTENIFNKMFVALKEKGVLVTYSAKGDVRRAMQAVGFKVEKLPGPPGKREMLRAFKDY